MDCKLKAILIIGTRRIRKGRICSYVTGLNNSLDTIFNNGKRTSVSISVVNPNYYINALSLLRILIFLLRDSRNIVEQEIDCFKIKDLIV